MPRITSVPSSSSSSGVVAFTVPRVPTGMKTGVRMSPCGVWITPSLACEFRDFLVISKNGCFIVFRRFFLNLWDYIGLMGVMLPALPAKAARTQPGARTAQVLCAAMPSVALCEGWETAKITKKPASFSLEIIIDPSLCYGRKFNIEYFSSSPLPRFSTSLALSSPSGGRHIGWHSPIPARGKRYGSDFRSVRYAAAFELIRKKAFYECV